MFSYDATMMVLDLPLVDIYRLMRPKAREITRCDECRRLQLPGATTCRWCDDGGKVKRRTQRLPSAGRRYDFFAGSLSVTDRRERRLFPGHKVRAARSTKVWDVFRFFGCSFVKAFEYLKIRTSA